VEHNTDVLTSGNRALYQQFDYDRYGNRGLNLANTSTSLNPNGQALQLADLSTATNRITKANYSYDAAGNLTAEPAANGAPAKSYTLYDGENRLKTATAGSTTSSYCYNADGQRVRRAVGSTTTFYVYDASGKLLLEINASNMALIKEYIYKGGGLLATCEPGNVLKYATADHLGTPRAWTDASGGVVIGGRRCRYIRRKRYQIEGIADSSNSSVFPSGKICMRCAPRARSRGASSPTRWQLARGARTCRVSGCDSEHISATRNSAANSITRSSPRANSGGGAITLPPHSGRCS
jgi:hypothetical protein